MRTIALVSLFASATSGCSALVGADFSNLEWVNDSGVSSSLEASAPAGGGVDASPDWGPDATPGADATVDGSLDATLDSAADGAADSHGCGDATACLQGQDADAPPAWHKLNGICAMSISVAGNGLPWITGCVNGEPDGGAGPVEYCVVYDPLTESCDWQSVNGDFRQVSVTGIPQELDGGADQGVRLAAVDESRNISYGIQVSPSSVNWTAQPGVCSNGEYPVTISGFDDSIVATTCLWSTAPGAEGWAFQSNVGSGEAGAWSPVPGTGKQIAIAPDALQLWAIGSGNEVFQAFSGPPYVATPDSTWTRIAGCASQVSPGINQTAWAVGCDSDVHYWDGTQWSASGFPSSPGAQQVAVGETGIPWALGVDGSLYVYH